MTSLRTRSSAINRVIALLRADRREVRTQFRVKSAPRKPRQRSPQIWGIWRLLARKWLTIGEAGPDGHPDGFRAVIAERPVLFEGADMALAAAHRYRMETNGRCEVRSYPIQT